MTYVLQKPVVSVNNKHDSVNTSSNNLINATGNRQISQRTSHSNRQKSRDKHVQLLWIVVQVC